MCSRGGNAAEWGKGSLLAGRLRPGFWGHAPMLACTVDPRVVWFRRMRVTNARATSPALFGAPAVQAVVLLVCVMVMQTACTADKATSNRGAVAKGADEATTAVVATDPAQASGKPADEAHAWRFPAKASEYAKMVESELGVPPRIDLSEAVEIPVYLDGVQVHGNRRRACDNPSFLGKDTVSGSTLQRHEGRTADGTPLPDVVWVSFARNSTRDPANLIGSVQMIGYHKKTGATAFFESCDQIKPWVKLDEGTLRMRGVMPWIDDPAEFDRAFVPPEASRPQCVQCHQADPFITNDFINAAKMPGTDENVVPILDQESPYYVIGGENWDMRTIHIPGNGCFECHRVGLSTMSMFMENGWDPNAHMPPKDPGSLAVDAAQLLKVLREGPASVEGARWVVPPAKGRPAATVGDDYPHQAQFNRAKPASKRKDK